MSDDAPVLDADAVRFLLGILELRRCRLSGAIAEMEPGPTARLIGAGLLVPDGHEDCTASLADHDDVPVSLIWSEQHNSLAYFGPAVGLVPVPHERLILHAVDMAAALRGITSELDLRPGKQPHVLIEDVLWEIGDVRIGKRPARIPLWFARRLADPEVQRQVIDAAHARPHTAQRIILTSSHPGRVRGVAIPGAAIIPMTDVLASPDNLAIDAQILDARLRGVAPPARGPVVLSPDGTRLTIRGGDPIPFKSATQIAAIRKLVAAFDAGGRVAIGELTEHGKLGSLFGQKKWSQLKPYIKSVNGLWGFDL